jgi:mycothiol S-conjugate amidase
MGAQRLLLMSGYCLSPRNILRVRSTVTLRLLAVHAHPDDESSKGAATCAYYRSRGARVMVVSCTGGERGDVLNEQLERRAMAERDLPGLRRIEMAAAQAIIGVEHRWLGYYDSGMPSGEDVPSGSFADIPLSISVAPLVKLIREFRPHVMVTYDENGGYPHPDHIRCHQVSVKAYSMAGDPTQHPTLGEPWQIRKLYYDRIMNIQRLDAISQLIQHRHGDSKLLESMTAMRSWMERPTPVTTQVPAGDFFKVRDSALRAHASQVAPNSAFFFWPNELQHEAWPYEDFELVDSKVMTTVPENDLFAGIEDTQ